MMELLEETGTLLYRGTGLTEEELKSYSDKIGKTEEDSLDPDGDGLPVYMPLTGFTSTSMNRGAAEGFAWSNPKTGHTATLFQIMWKRRDRYYVMDMSAFPDEKEVLLYDGTKFEVLSIEKTAKQSGETLIIIVLKC